MDVLLTSWAILVSSQHTCFLFHSLIATASDSEPLTDLKQNPSVEITRLPSIPNALRTGNKIVFLLLAPLKVSFQIWGLWSALAYSLEAHEWMLIQNPPSIPTLFLAIVVCYLRGTKLVIDWHNFGYSILALRLGNEHPLVKFSKQYEKFLARFAYCHFTVTHAMCDMLRSDFSIDQPIFTLHDRPPPLFQPLSEVQRTAFLTKHPLTAAEAHHVIEKKTRLVVSSTSWTTDEDFSVLLDALCSYSASATSDSPQLPELLVVITGKGPMKQHYLDKIKQLEEQQELEMITIETAWLPIEDYAALLGAADLGVSLHTSSSGVDLPMKVVDMFGVGLPVLGYSNYTAWSELVQEDVNGKGFSNAEQMSDSLKRLFDPANNDLEILKLGALQESKHRWSSEWNPVAVKLFRLHT